MLRLASKDGNRIGNAILYGGNDGMLTLGSLVGQVEEPKDRYYVETDFGNHMTLTWAEVTELFDIKGVQGYEQWKHDRRQLQNEPNLIQLNQQRNMADFGDYNGTN